MTDESEDLGPFTPEPRTVLACCDSGARYVYLEHEVHYVSDDETPEDFLARHRSVPPVWRVHVNYSPLDYNQPYKHVSATAICCPFCSAPVPKVMPRYSPPWPIQCAIGGYYCSSCDQRANCCRCHRTDELWEVAESALSSAR